MSAQPLWHWCGFCCFQMPENRMSLAFVIFPYFFGEQGGGGGFLGLAKPGGGGVFCVGVPLKLVGIWAVSKNSIGTARHGTARHDMNIWKKTQSHSSCQLSRNGVDVSLKAPERGSPQPSRYISSAPSTSLSTYVSTTFMSCQVRRMLSQSF